MNSVRFISCFACLLFIFSCNTLKITNKKKISDLAIEWNSTEKANPLYEPAIDSVFDKVMARFNNEVHPFKVHKKTGSDQDYITLTFKKGRFVSPAGVAAGYVISGIGLLVTPFVIYAASGQQAIAAFYYFPSDYLTMSAGLSPSLSYKKKKSNYAGVRANSLFSNPAKRIRKISRKLDDVIYKTLIRLERQVE